MARGKSGVAWTLRMWPRALLGGTVAILSVAAMVLQAAAQDVTITFMHWGTQEYADRYRALIEAFEAKNPGIKIEQLHTPEGYPEKLRAMFAGGTPPDTFILDMQETAYFAQFDLLVDLRPLAERDPEYRFEELNPLAVDIMSSGGRVLGLPADTGPNVYFYNATMFDEAALPYPDRQYQSGGWTWTDFREAALKLTRRQGDGSPVVMGAAVHRGGALHRLWMWSNGAPEFDDIKVPTESLYHTPASIETFEFLQALLHVDRVATVSNADIGNQDPSPAFASGRLAMMARWTTGISYLADSDVLFGIAPYPKGPGPEGRHAADFATSGYAIAKSARHQEAAWRWVAFASSAEGQAIIPGSEGPSLPSRRGIEVTFLPPNMVNPEFFIETIMLPANGNHVRLLARDQAEIHRIINSELNLIWNNQAAPATVLPRITERVNLFLQEWPQH